MKGRAEVTEFLRKKWEKENGYRLRKELFAFADNKIAVQVRRRGFSRARGCLRQTHAVAVSVAVLLRVV